jgi:hypothetical protein
MYSLAQRLLLVVLMAGLGVACATLNDVIKAKQQGKGVSKVYPINEDDAWKIAKRVFRWEGTDAIEEHRDEGFMLTSSGMNLVSYGAVMGAWIERVDEENTKVTVVSKRRLSTDLFTTMTHGRFHDLFARAVNIVRSGQPLPLTSPG